MTEETTLLRRRIRELEDRIQALRSSRRILMDLLSLQEKAKETRIRQLERENRVLRRRAREFAQRAIERANAFHQLKDRFRGNGIE